MRRLRVPPSTWPIVSASGLATLGTSPVFLLSAQSVFVRRELEFSAARFGIAVGVFFAAAATTALLGGGVADRVGRRYSTVLSGLIAATGGLGLTFLAHSWLTLVGWMLVLGIANASCQVTSNLTLARAVPPHRRALGFGVKQSAIPLAMIVAGLAVPTVATSMSWRWTFAATGVLGVVVVAIGLLLPRGGAVDRPTTSRPDRPSLVALVVAALAITLGSAAANSFAAFIASWGFEVGLTPSEAGLLMAAGSALNVAARIFVGHRADRRHGRNLPTVAVQMFVGALGLSVVSVATPAALVPVTLAVFAIGWSWPGLLIFAVVRVGREAPGTASGIVQAGAFAGGAAGPVVFGAVVAWQGYEAAWRMAAVLFLVAAALVVLARRLFIADLVARPPRQPLGYGGGRDMPARVTATSPSVSGSEDCEGGCRRDE